jgi:hypothetical protein
MHVYFLLSSGSAVIEHVQKVCSPGALEFADEEKV